MKRVLAKLFAASSILLSSLSNASIITNADVAALTVTSPLNWTFIHSSSLLNGITANSANEAERFVGFRNNGTALSAANPFVIDMSLKSATVITGFSFFNDWGLHLNQQVMTMKVDVFSAGTTLYTNLFNALALNRFDEIGLASGLLLSGADQITFTILGLQNTNFEIREFVITTQEAEQVVVSAPSVGVLALFMLTSGFAFRRRIFA